MAGEVLGTGAQPRTFELHQARKQASDSNSYIWTTVHIIGVDLGPPVHLKSRQFPSGMKEFAYRRLQLVFGLCRDKLLEVVRDRIGESRDNVDECSRCRCVACHAAYSITFRDLKRAVVSRRIHYNRNAGHKPTLGVNLPPVLG